MKNRINKILVLIMILLSFVPISKVSAKDDASKGLTISPLRTELNINPGISIDGLLTVTNSTNSMIEVNLGAEEFNVVNERYDYSFSPNSGVSKWITFKEERITLAIGGKKQIQYSVSVPINAEPGGRYVSIFASTAAQLNDAKVSSIQRVSSLLYITVVGDVTKIGKLLSINSPKILKKDSVYVFLIQNNGTTHFVSRYSVAVKNLFDNEDIVGQSSDSLILPGTIKSVSGTIPTPKLPGLYRAIYQLGLGDMPAVKKVYYMLYLPIEFILFAASIAVSLWFIIKKTRKSRY